MNRPFRNALSPLAGGLILSLALIVHDLFAGAVHAQPVITRNKGPIVKPSETVKDLQQNVNPLTAAPPLMIDEFTAKRTGVEVFLRFVLANRAAPGQAKLAVWSILASSDGANWVKIKSGSQDVKTATSWASTLNSTATGFKLVVQHNGAGQEWTRTAKVGEVHFVVIYHFFGHRIFDEGSRTKIREDAARFAKRYTDLGMKADIWPHDPPVLGRVLDGATYTVRVQYESRTSTGYYGPAERVFKTHAEASDFLRHLTTLEGRQSSRIDIR